MNSETTAPHLQQGASASAASSSAAAPATAPAAQAVADQRNDSSSHHHHDEAFSRQDMEIDHDDISPNSCSLDLDHEQEENKANNSGTANGFLQLSKEDFIANVMAAAFDGSSTNETTQDQWNAAKAKLDDLSLWIAECKIRVNQEERVRRKAQREEELRAIYLPKEPISSSSDSSHNTDTNRRSHFTPELATVLLDSGFLSSGGIGNLCLLTGKFFFATLKLDPDYVWKCIFQAKFNSQMGHGLASLYQNGNFKKILDAKGYEWMFRNFFVGKRMGTESWERESDDSENESNDLENESDDSESVPLIQGNQGIPPSALNCKNLFFVALIQIPDEFGCAKVIHAQVLNNEQNIGVLLSGETNAQHDYVATISSKKAMNYVQRRHNDAESLLADKWKVKFWKENLQKEFDKCPKHFHPKVGRLLRALESCLARGRDMYAYYDLVDFMFRPVVTILALRIDKYECTVLYNYRHETYEKTSAESLYSIDELAPVTLNSNGKALLERLLKDQDLLTAGDDDEDVKLAMWLVLCFERMAIDIALAAYWNSGSSESDMNLYPIFDYGIDWEGF